MSDIKNFPWFTIFVTALLCILKLAGIISISWWWCFCLLWLPIALALIALGICFVILVLVLIAGIIIELINTLKK